MEKYLNTIINGDSLEKLKLLPNDSVDLVVTDPPYGYSFMGKNWDKAVPSVEIWKETLRVLKPGAFAFIMSAPRQDVLSQMIVRIGEAGFKTDFTSLYWTYASGFPKAMNIGKMVDKRNGRNEEQFKALGNYLSEKIIDSDSVCAKKVAFSPALVRFWRIGERIPNKETYLKLKELYSLDSRFDELIEREEAEREIVGKKENQMSGWNTDGSTKFVDRDITLAETPKAKALDGSYGGFQPKPAVEVIIVAMKPLSEKTYVDQALKNGKGITWLDDTRIPGQYKDPKPRQNKEQSIFSSPKILEVNTQGRFPANLLVSDDVLNDGRITKGTDNPRHNSKDSDIYGKYNPSTSYGFADSGSYSRYFDLDKWANTLPFLITPKASKSEKNRGLEDIKETQVMGGGGTNSDVSSAYGAVKAKQSNSHPTVKPLKLMSYLITLGSREGDTILEPFAGSGTTCLAAKELKRNYIGIEREKEYCDICEARLENLQPTLI
jgi:DNA modification methylase